MKDEVRVYTLYGLRIQSEITLPAPLAPDDLPPYNLQVRWGERKAIADAAPAGEILARLILANGRGYTLVDTGSGYTLRFHQTAEFWLDYALRSARAHLAPEVHPGIAGLLVVGNVCATVLTLAGEAVLHASAVEIDGSALAFLGSSGMGKSSLAALLCAHGGRFVTDDLLRLQPDGRGWRCYPGTGQLRLRQNAAVLSQNFSAAVLEATPDDRIAVNMEPGPAMPRLGAVVIPHPSRQCDTLKLERLAPARALLYLMAYPRIQELPQKNQRQRRLDFLGRIAANIPVFTAEIPWGLPSPRSLAATLAQGVLGVE